MKWRIREEGAGLAGKAVSGRSKEREGSCFHSIPLSGRGQMCWQGGGTNASVSIIWSVSF